jgi:hypothetical protein
MVRLALSIITLISIVVSGVVIAAETRPVVESYACDFKSGKDIDDLNSAVKYWQGQVDKIGSTDLDGYFAVTAMPLMGRAEADFYWFGVNPNLNQMVRAQTAYTNSTEGQSADKRFIAMSRCKMNAYFLEPIYSGYEAEADDDDGVLEIFGCTLKEGQDMSDVQEAEETWQKQAAGMGFKVAVYRWDNFKTISQYDLVYLEVNDDLESFGANTTTWLTTDSARSADAAFASVMTCDSAVLSSHIIHRPKPQQ